MNFKVACIALFAIGIVSATFSDEVVSGYAEQFDECLQSCSEKYGKNGYKKSYPQKENECNLSCEDKYSAEYGSSGFYPEKQAECKQYCDELYGKYGSKVTYPEKRVECHQRCRELYGFRKPVSH